MPNLTGDRLTSIDSMTSVQVHMEISVTGPIEYQLTSEQDLALSTHKVRNSVHLLVVAFTGLKQVTKSVKEISRKGRKIRKANINAPKDQLLRIALQNQAPHHRLHLPRSHHPAKA